MVARSFSFPSFSFVAAALILVAGGAFATPGCGSDSGEPSSSSGGHAAGGGGAGGGAGGAGAGGALPECTKASECPAPHDVCVEAACLSGACGTAPMPANTPVGDSTPGDCKKTVCDGSGHTTDVTDDGDVPPDEACVTNACNAGVVVPTDAAVGTSCPAGVCDDHGKCVGCNTTADCTQPTSECSFVTCDSHVCASHDKDAGTLLSTQTTGDCKSKICDGHGAVTDKVNDLDLPNDGNECTDDTCTGGVVGHPPISGIACGTSGSGLTCDDNGHCGGCTSASQCPAGDACKTATCTAGVCDFSFTAANTVVPDASGNCTVLKCDGHGQAQPFADPTDKPAEDGNACTVEGCSGTTALHDPAPIGTTCATGVCDGNKHCVECNSASNCPDTGNACKGRTCTSGTCGTETANEDGTVCAPAACNNGTASAASTCSGGSCNAGATTSCSPYACGATACGTSCGSDPACASGFTCDTGIDRCVAAGSPKCTDYCAELATNCTGAQTMYFSPAACLAVCAAFPLGVVTDTGGQNTLGCRLYHGGAPSASAPATHCPHAGPAGESVCGDECTSFCTLAAGLCTGAHQQWATMAACMSDCATFPTSPPYNAMTASGDSYACRLYHLTAASVDPNTHCAHIQKNSITCQ